MANHETSFEEIRGAWATYQHEEIDTYVAEAKRERERVREALETATWDALDASPTDVVGLHYDDAGFPHPEFDGDEDDHAGEIVAATLAVTESPHLETLREVVDCFDEQFEASTDEVAVFGLSVLNDYFARIRVAENRLAAAADADSGWSGVFQPVKSALQRLKSTLQQHLPQAFWSVVQAHTSLDSWSVSGDSGVSMLGLSGNVGLSATFK